MLPSAKTVLVPLSSAAMKVSLRAAKRGLVSTFLVQGLRRGRDVSSKGWLVAVWYLRLRFGRDAQVDNGDDDDDEDEYGRRMIQICLRRGCYC